eukprot:scaffold85533_cov18-Tisochrysis_lutea.AAC.1
MGKAAGSSFHALYMDGMQRHAPHSSVVVIRVARGAGLQPENLADRLLGAGWSMVNSGMSGISIKYFL